MWKVRKTASYEKWFRSLRDVRAQARINVRIRRIAETGNFGDVKSIGDGVSELRVDYGPGYRVYFVQRGQEIILLLYGGSKSSQKGDIEFAKMLV